MSAGEWVADTWVQAAGLVRRGGNCLNDSGAFGNCPSVWVALVYGLIAVGAIGAIFVLNRFLKRRRHGRELVDNDTRPGIDAEYTVQESRWRGDNALDTGEMTLVDISRRIREEKERIRQAAAQSPKDPSKGDRHLGMDSQRR